MLQAKLKTYEAPTLEELGVMKDITEAGNQPFADQNQGRDGTAFEVGS